MMSTDERTPRDTHCEFCGVDYANASDRPPERGAAKPSAPEEPPAEPVARCEFCGAEYPAPEGS